MTSLKCIKITSALPEVVIMLLFAAWLLVIPDFASAQTNDPDLSQQYYIFDHNIDQVWSYNNGSSNTNIAVHSMLGFTTSHEDLDGARYPTPWTQWLGPQHGNASEMAGIIGAQTNNFVGIAGINWNATLKSYNILRQIQSGDNNPDATFSYGGNQYYLDTGKLDAMVDQAIQDGMDVQVFNFGVPIAKTATLKDYEGMEMSNLLSVPTFPLIQFPTTTFQDGFKSTLASLGGDIWTAIQNNNYHPPSDLELFYEKLAEFTQSPNNGVTVAPSGDTGNTDLFEDLMPAAFDDYVVTVAGAEKDQSSQEYVQWSNSHADDYVDVAAAANNIYSISGTGYDQYNNSFSSTTASAAIGAGVASLLKAENSNLTHDDIEQILERTATDLEGAGYDNKTGHGFINAQAALNFVRNNDVIHGTAGNSNIEILNDEEIYPFLTDMVGDEYFDYWPGWQNPDFTRGKLKKITGEVTFELPFSSSPEVWLKMTSSGIDNNLAAGNKHYYDQFQKAFEVTSVTDDGFIFELYYWDTTFYTILGQPLNSNPVSIPDINNLSLKYTAVGNQLSSWPLDIDIFGLDYYTQGSNGFWNALIDEGNPPYLTHWYRSYDGTAPWTQVGTGSSYSQTVSHEMYLKAIVNDANSNTAEDIMHVFIQSCGSPPCPMPKRIGKNSLAAPIPEHFGIRHNYPNPFNPETTIRFDLPELAEVTLEVYNIMGRRVATLIDGAVEAGQHLAKFNGSGMASGTYIARLSALGQSGEIFTKELTMQLIK